jgi:hypothetical protein
MRRAVVAATAASLMFSPLAAGHGSIRPTVASPGAAEEFTFVVLNGRDAGIMGFRLELPSGATAVDVTAQQPTWVATSRGNRIEWRGGPIPGRAFESFQARVRMPGREGRVTFTGTELFADGPGVPYRLDVVLAAGAAAATEATDEGARTLAAAALVVGIAALLLSAATLAFTIARRRRAT